MTHHAEGLDWTHLAARFGLTVERSEEPGQTDDWGEDDWIVEWNALAEDERNLKHQLERFILRHFDEQTGCLMAFVRTEMDAFLTDLIDTGKASRSVFQGIQDVTEDRVYLFWFLHNLDGLFAGSKDEGRDET